MRDTWGAPEEKGWPDFCGTCGCSVRRHKDGICTRCDECEGLV